MITMMMIIHSVKPSPTSSSSATTTTTGTTKPRRTTAMHPSLSSLLVLLGNLGRPASFPGLFLLALLGPVAVAVAEAGQGQVGGGEEAVHAEFEVQPAEDVAGDAAGGAEGCVVGYGYYGEGEGNYVGEKVLDWIGLNILAQ